MKRCSVFPKAPASLELTIRLLVSYQDTHSGGNYSSEEVQSVYSTTTTNIRLSGNLIFHLFVWKFPLSICIRLLKAYNKIDKICI